MKRVAITGVTGAIGIALIEACIENEIEVYALVHKNSKRNARIPKHKLLHLIDCDLDEIIIFDADNIKPCDAFFHLGWAATMGAGRNDMQMQLKNIQYTLDAIHLAHRLGCKAFIGVGSQAEYGRYEGKLNEKVPTFPENGYGMAKLCAGQMSAVVCEQLGMRFVWARVLSVYGPYDNDNTMISTTIKKLLQGEIPALTYGEQKWDYLYSKDAGKALLLLGSCENARGIYCLGSGSFMPLRKYIETIRDAIDPTMKLGFGEIPYADKQVMYLWADIEKLQKDTNFQPGFSFEEGIFETIEWIKKRLANEEN
ncbi:MAG: NAD(P)-dependent oxidoreductase [Eubacteriales bacterium]|nr:NAD(P)-dependent oxidoreductase [Eubacteriales bacterium]